MADRNIPSARDRLDKISHFYLSDIEDTVGSTMGPQLLPIIMADESTQPYFYALARGLHEQGLTIRILHTDKHLRASDPRLSPRHTHMSDSAVIPYLDEIGHDEDNMHEPLYLIPGLRPNKSDWRTSTHGVILSPANLDGQLASYRIIKQMAQHGYKQKIGIVITGCKELKAAYHFFDQLSAAGLRFLSSHIAFIGYLPAGNQPNTINKEASHAVVTALLRNGYISPNTTAKAEDTHNIVL